jgi:hypothetical protein
MNQFTKAWDENIQNFSFSENSFDLEYFTNLLSIHAEKFKKDDVDYKQHFGFIEKFDLPSIQKIYIRADLHGDLKSLIENIKVLKSQQLLDANYKCCPNVHLVFLGDYCDRGDYGTQILEILIRLREENPENVHLIRGNHEYIDINSDYGKSDTCLKQIISDEKAKKALESFYETLPLTTYFSINKKKREYIQCTHGLFEPTTDPDPLLDKKETKGYLPVPKTRKLSERIQKIPKNNKTMLSLAAKRINEIVLNSKSLESDMTVYNWGDISEDNSELNSLGDREYALNAQDIQYYLTLSSEQHRVMMLFRGHEHNLRHLVIKEDKSEKILVTTLPVGTEIIQYENKSDHSYILTLTSKISKSKKQIINRERSRSISTLKLYDINKIEPDSIEKPDVIYDSTSDKY